MHSLFSMIWIFPYFKILILVAVGYCASARQVGDGVQALPGGRPWHGRLAFLRRLPVPHA